MRMPSRVPGYGRWAAGGGLRAASCGRRASGQKRCALRATGQTHRFGLASLCDASPSSTGRIGLHMADMPAAAKADPTGFVDEVKRVSVNFPALTSIVDARKRPGGNLPRPWCSVTMKPVRASRKVRMPFRSGCRGKRSAELARCSRPSIGNRHAATGQGHAHEENACKHSGGAHSGPRPAARGPRPATSRSCTRDRRFVRRRTRASRSSRRRACSAS